MPEISLRAEQMPASPIRKLVPLADAARARGTKIYHLNIGQPDLPSPKEGLESLKHIDRKVLEYSPSDGYRSLREKLVTYYEQYQIKLSPEEIIVTTGGSEAVLFAFMSCLNPGDEIIIPAPFWVSYYEMVRMVGGTPVIVEAGEEQNFKITAQQLEAAITEKTKCLMLNNPSNPTGMIYSADELRAIADVCVKHDLYILADEIYYQLIYDGIEFTSIASLGDEVKERTLLINGVSKSYAMTGWRVGYCAANKTLAKIMSNFLSHSTGAPSTISQWASVKRLPARRRALRQCGLLSLSAVIILSSALTPFPVSAA